MEAIIGLLIQAALMAIQKAKQIKDAASQTGELTPEASQRLDARIAEAHADPAWAVSTPPPA